MNGVLAVALLPKKVSSNRLFFLWSYERRRSRGLAFDYVGGVPLLAEIAHEAPKKGTPGQARLNSRSFFHVKVLVFQESR